MKNSRVRVVYEFLEPEDSEERKIFDNSVRMYNCLCNLSGYIHGLFKTGDLTSREKEILDQITLYILESKID